MNAVKGKHQSNRLFPKEGGRLVYVHVLFPKEKDLGFYCQVVNTLVTSNLSQAPRRWEVYSARAHPVEQMMVR